MSLDIKADESMNRDGRTAFNLSSFKMIPMHTAGSLAAKGPEQEIRARLAETRGERGPISPFSHEKAMISTASNQLTRLHRLLSASSVMTRSSPSSPVPDYLDRSFLSLLIALSSSRVGEQSSTFSSSIHSRPIA